MKSKPVLFRRTTSSVPDDNNATTQLTSGRDSPAVFLEPAPGSGGHIEPSSAIPIADPGYTDDVSVNTHKRKQSGIPLEAEEIYNRASVQTSLERINDEEEGGGGSSSIPAIGLNRSFSEADMQQMDHAPLQVSMSHETDANSTMAGSIGSSPASTIPEFSDLFPEDNHNNVIGRVTRVVRSMVSSQRGVAAIAMLMFIIGYVTMKGGHPNTKQVGIPIHNPSTGGGFDVSTPSQSNNPDSKEITIGEYHDEEVGVPMEHTIHEYNKIIFFDSPDKMKPLVSKGPILFDPNMDGLHLFENVCLTNNIDQLRFKSGPESTLRGLIYFKNAQEEDMTNPKRCLPCSNNDDMTSWDGTYQDEKLVGHKCGMNGIHAMFATSVGDWSSCIMEDTNMKLMEDMQQTQSPLNVSTIHFFQEPTFLLQFNSMDMEESLFSMLMGYLPHWNKWLMGGGNDDDGDQEGFPFNSVISHSLQGCLGHSHNWFCEILHQMYAFGEAKEIPWESNDSTLYCYHELLYNQVGYQRNMDHEGLVSKEVFGSFREMLFRKFALPRRRTVEDRLAEKEAAGTTSSEDTKIIFYDNKLSDQQTVWKEMESLISKARELEKFQHIKFVTVNKSFDDLSVAQQARMFNEADAIIMARGQHMANAIFSVDGTSFVELGCKAQSLVGNPRFMELIDGKYKAVERCSGSVLEGGGDVCVICKSEDDDSSFTMEPEMFVKLIDDIVASLG